MIRKRNLTIIITLILIILLTITTPIQAVTIGQVYNLKSEIKGNTVYFSWSSVTNADGYDLYINTSNRGYQYIGSVTGTTASVIGFQSNETYTAKVCAYKINSYGVKEAGNFSSAITVNFKASTTNLQKVETLNVSQNGGLISLNWSKVSNATGYEIFANAPGQDYTNLGTVVGNNSAFISGAINGDTYYFKIRAYKILSSGAIEYGEFSPARGIYINNNQYDDKPSVKPEENKPSNVTNLYVSSINENKVEINWTKINNAEGYEIYLAQGNGSFYYLDTVYNNYAALKNLEYNTTYKVKVRAYNYANGYIQYGNFSTITTFTTGRNNSVIESVKNLYIDVEDNTAYLDWTKVNNTAGYEIYLAQGNGAFYYLNTVYNNYATLKNLAYNTTYKVKVRAYNYANGYTQYGDFSTIKTFTTKQSTLDTQVTGLTVSNVEQKKATISWNKISGVDGYNIYLSTNNARNFKFIKTTTGRSATLENLDYSTTYYVKVCAYKFINGKEVEGPASTYKQFTTKERGNLAQVTHLSVKVKNRNEAYLSWWPIDGASGYEVYLSEAGKSYEKVDDTDIVNTIIYSNELDYNTSYQVKVRAYEYVNGMKRYGNYSSSVTFKTEGESKTEGNDNVPRVRNVVANVVGDTVTLTWDKVEGAVKYDVYFTVPGIGDLGNYSTNTNSKVISGLTDTEYYYTARVRAYKYVNGKLVSGPYSYISRFTGK